MKKIILTAAICLATLISSAQFILISDISKPSDDEQWSVSNFTNNAGVGYEVNDKLTIGVRKNNEEYDLYTRYNLGYGFYVSLQSSTEDFDLENADLGLGYSLNVWSNFYVEPTYNRNGEFKIGAACRF